MSAVSIRLPDDIAKRLQDLAQRTVRSKTYYIREAIKERIEDLEDYYLAAATMERVRKGEEALISSAKVRADLGLDD